MLKLVETLIVMQVLLRQSLWGQLSEKSLCKIYESNDFCKNPDFTISNKKGLDFLVFAGLDSLSLISLARRLSSKVNKVRSVELRRKIVADRCLFFFFAFFEVITVADLSDNPTPRPELKFFQNAEKFEYETQRC